MQRIALASRPCRACPYDAVTGYVFCDFISGFLIKQCIQVVQQFGFHAFIEGIHVDVFSKIGFDAGHAHIQQILQQSFIPFGCFGVSEVNGSGIVQSGEIGTFRILFLCQRSYIIVFACFVYLFGVLRHVGELP